MPKLVVIQGPTTGLEHHIRGDVILGRDPRCQVVISHREVSGQHARLSRLGDRYYIEDLGSRNGTYVRSIPIQRQALADGDEIAIGRTVLRFEDRPPPDLSIKTTDPGSMTIEVDARGDIIHLGDAVSGVSQRRMDNVLRLLCDVSRTIGSISGLKSTLEEIAGTLLEVFPQCGRVMVLLTSDGVSLEPLVIRWRTAPDMPSTQYSETVVKRALTERRAILTVDALSDDRFSSSRSVVDLRLRSLMCAPILHRDEVLGVVELDTVMAARMFTEEDLNLLTGIVAQLAFAVANAKLFDELRGQMTGTVSALCNLMSLKSPGLMAHAERVSRLTSMMARRLELSQEEAETLRVASLLHDVGLLSLPDELWQPDQPPLWFIDHPEATGLETGHQSLLRAHMERAAELLGPVLTLQPVVQIIMAHHERFDGHGYPKALSGTAIPLGARILAIADAFDALTDVEPNQGIEARENAIRNLREQAGNAFDPDLVELFVQIWEARMRLEERRSRDARGRLS